MLKRCAWRPLGCPQRHHVSPSVTRSRRTLVEFRRLSSSAKQESPSPKPRKWKLYAVVGLVGFTLGSWYRILGFTKSKDSSFQPFELIAKEPVSSTASIFTIKSLSNKISTSAWKAGVWNVEFKQPQLQIVRSYTPLPPLPDDLDPDAEAVQTLRFLIRQDAKGGEMSSYLHRLPLGAQVELRGPNIEYQITDDTKNVIFIAGGTGIAPALQIAHALFDGLSLSQKKERRLHIIWANRKREDCTGGDRYPDNRAESSVSHDRLWWWQRWTNPSRQQQTSLENVASASQPPNAIVKHLNNLKAEYGDNVQVSYFVDEEKSYIHSGTIEEALTRLQDAAPNAQTEVIVSGPPGFITYLAGPKLWKDGEEQQGPLGGRLAQVLRKDQPDVKVWKI